jgi:hypothetical protein
MPWRHGSVFWRFRKGASERSDDVVHIMIIWLSVNYRIAVAIFSGLSLVVWTLKREVRASGECLGMYRR